MRKTRRINLPFVSFLLALALSAGMNAHAQTFNNEWINFNSTYYKFKIGKDSLYRITTATLALQGLDTVPVQYLRMYRNGEQVPFYSSVENGLLPADGYLEFWGWANDGLPDKPLYRNGANQHTSKYSLHSDTAVYFLTIERNLPNSRFINVTNNVAGNALPAEQYFMHTAGRYYRDKINPGYAADLEQYVYSSSYDRGEFWSGTDIGQRVTRNDVQANLKPFAGGPNAEIRFGAFGNTVKTRRIRLDLNGVQLLDTAVNFFSEILTSVNFPVSQLTTTNNTIAFTNVQPPKPPTGPDPYTDRFVLSYYELLYPREFDFGNARRFYFELAPRTTGHYLEIRNFNATGGTPVLYDFATGERYVANTQVTGVLRFALTPSGVRRRLMLVSQAPTFMAPVTQLAEKKFTNFLAPEQQGNYLIISNPKLYTGSAGNNPVDDYRIYRSSTTGGGFDARIYDINELADQFAFGIKGHPLAVKNFIRFARARFSRPVSYVFIIGKGVNYSEYKLKSGALFIEQAMLDNLNLVPTYGYPGSDNLLASETASNPIAATPIGRLSVVNGTEIENYLEKMKEYETAQRNSANSIEGRLWMKNLLHVTGASNALLGAQLCNFMTNYKNLVEDTLTGAKVTLLCKGTSGEVNQANSQRVHSLFEEGLTMLTYFGHSSASTLEFNIENPEAYNNTGKYPVFSVNGCYAGDFFRYGTQRFSSTETLSEKFTLAKKKGGIAFIASTHFGVLNYLSVYLNSYYEKMSKTDYGASLGRLTTDALQGMLNAYSSMDFIARAHAEQITLHGDPALYMNFQPRADYVIEAPQIQVEPTFISVADVDFNVKIKYYNIGKAPGDSVDVEVKRTFPNGTSTVVYSGKRAPVNYADSLSFTLPIAALTDKGENKISVSIDGQNLLDEMDEGNNSVTTAFFIYEDEATPVFPYNFSIVNDPGQKLFASTADPFAGAKQYVMEIDTTAFFNSSMKKSVTISSKGGLLEFDPQVNYIDSTVYYWRTALVPSSGSDPVWNESSFLYRDNQQYGYNQSHFFQHLKTRNDRIRLDSVSRNWEFLPKNNDLFIRQATYPSASGEQADFSISVNNGAPFGAGCAYDELIFHVFDKNTFSVWKNDFTGATGLYESYRAVCGGGRSNNFEYLLNTQEWRKKAMDFMDLIPDGSYVLVRNNGNPTSSGNTYPAVWMADTAAFGSGNSLYHRLLAQGFTELDSINRPRAWAFVYKKNSKNSFTPVTRISVNQFDKLAFGVNAPTPNVSGSITSPAFGPARAWKELVWNGQELEADGNDQYSLTLIGVAPDRSETVLRELAANEKNVDISAVSVTDFPYLKLKLNATDSTKTTPYQLKFWRLIYDPVPEGALAPNLFFSSSDSVQMGTVVNFGIAFKNVSKVAFDSLRVKVILTDQNNVPHVLPDTLLKPVIAGDTVNFRYPIDTRNYPGQNTLFVEFNPMDDHQPEQHHFNNFLYRNLFVGSDRTKPVMDVTFDNAHILNGDIVSARPHIQIRLKDESKYLLLKDTSLISVKVKFPDGSMRTYRYDNDTVKFTPAASAADNTALIDFFPSFLQTFNEDGTDNYELVVTAKDASNNTAGENDYNVNFVVINKPMISNLLNYPNPFTTSTAFVFTITGSEVPTNFKIQIMTVTGKIVREITGDELGPLRIGRNITEFKWDGTDQYGQRLANGVYLYRVITTLHGRKMDKFKAVGDDTDKFFTRGYGKMYLMR